jgi:hypothetical protein
VGLIVVDAGVEAVERTAHDIDLHGIKGTGGGVRAEEEGLAVGVANPVMEACAPRQEPGDRAPVDVGDRGSPCDSRDRVERRPIGRRCLPLQRDFGEADVSLEGIGLVRPVHHPARTPDAFGRVLRRFVVREDLSDLRARAHVRLSGHGDVGDDWTGQPLEVRI